MKRHSSPRPTIRLCALLIALASALAVNSLLAVTGPAPTPPPTEKSLLAILKSNAAPADKAIACKQLAIYGGKDSVPALAALLTNPELASWARIPLEAIPDPAADAALRKSLSKVQGNLLVGVINSIGVRRDPKAVSDLVKQLKGSNPTVVAAAAEALGRIGGAKAAKALAQALESSPAAARAAVADGCVLCAERFLQDAKPADAVKLCDAVRAANVPREQQLEAIRGAILARQSAGLALLLEQLRSPEPDLFGIGLRTARELPGRPVTEALAAEVRQCKPARQSFLLLAIADRSDDAVPTAILDALRSGSPTLRLTAVGILDRQGSYASLPALLAAAADADPKLAQAALGALSRLPGNDVDADLLARLPNATGKNREVLILVAGQRHLEKAIVPIFLSLKDSNAGVRGAAVQAIGILGTDAHAAELVDLLQSTKAEKEQADIQTALLAIISRSGARTVPALLPLTHNTDGAMKIIALHLLASAGGPHALEAVQAALQDQDSAVQDEAVRTLSTWPNNWPDDSSVANPLLAIARSDAKTSHQVLALRGYLQYLQGDKQLKHEAKLDRLNEVMPLIKRPEEKRLAIAALGTVPNPRALDMLVVYVKDPDLAEDACSAVVKLAESCGAAVPEAQRRQALELVAKTTTTDATKKAARKLLNPAK